MAKTKIVLQPATEITTTATQAVDLAAPVGNAKTGVAIVDIYNVATAGVYTFAIDHASSAQANSGATRSNWVLNAQTSTGSLAAGAASTITIALTNIGEVIRWRATAVPGVCTFTITVFLWDT